MKLTGIAEFGPIKKFDTIELPDFAIIIGPNGVGKSQFLQAVTQGYVALGERTTSPDSNTTYPPVSPSPPPFTVLITNSDALPPLTDNQSSNAMHNHNQLLGSVSQQKINSTQNILISLATDLGVELAGLLSTADDPWALGPKGLTEKLGFKQGSIEQNRIAEAFQEADLALNNIHNPSYRNPISQTLSAIKSISERLNVRPSMVTQELVTENGSIGYFSSFSPQIDRVVSHYRDKLSNNNLAEYNGEVKLDCESFQAIYGRPPWEVIDEALSNFGLPYKIVRPLFASPPPAYILAFQRTGAGSAISPQNISAGEKVLLRFILAILPYDPLRVAINHPRHLLLDELDASLHPQIVRRWMETLQEEFVAKRGVTCLLTTHSPITVALAPDHAIFYMTNEDAVPRPITKQQALNRLTVGLPTLSVNYSGQRQVFTESDTDAAIFNSINTNLKKQLNLSRSLTFISTGYRTKRDNSEENAGFSVVTNVTTALRNSGNRAVYGLVDWDGSRISTEYIKVVGEDTHYTLENLLLDPLLIGVLLLRDSEVQLPHQINLRSLDSNNTDTRQAIANFVQDSIKYPGGTTGDYQAVEYLDSTSIQVRVEFTRTPGHTIEKILADAFPYLVSFSKNRGKMPKEIVDRVISLYPELCPLPIATVFRSISDGDD